MKAILVLAVCGACIFLSCQTARNMPLPPNDIDLDPDQKKEMVSNYSLSFENNFFTGSHISRKISPTKYAIYDAKILFQDSNALANSKYTEAITTDTISLILAGAGGGLIGWPLGKTLSSKQWDTSDYILLSSGIGVAVTGIIISVISGNTLSEAIKYYNLYLENEKYK